MKNVFMNESGLIFIIALVTLNDNLECITEN